MKKGRFPTRRTATIPMITADAVKASNFLNANFHHWGIKGYSWNLNERSRILFYPVRISPVYATIQFLM